MIRYTAKVKHPTRKNSKDAGMDLYSSEEITINPMSFGIVETGVRFIIPKGYMIQLWPKSKANYLLGAGIVDESFRGSIKVKVYNCSNASLTFQVGDPVAQAVLVKTTYPKLENISDEKYELDKTDRGDTGGIVSQKAQLSFITAEEAAKF